MEVEDYFGSLDIISKGPATQLFFRERNGVAFANDGAIIITTMVTNVKCQLK